MFLRADDDKIPSLRRQARDPKHPAPTEPSGADAEG